jgi:protein-S-isoprenylcysteine O-methyltransferase
MNHMTLPLLPIILSLIWGASECGLALTRRAKSDAISKDRHSRALIWIVYTLSIWFGMFAMFAVRAWALPRPEMFRLLGLCVFVSGQAFRWYSIIYLGRFFTANVAIADDHRLIDSGPYRLIRHPSYTGNLMAVMGFGPTMVNMASLLILVVPTFAVHFWRMRIEEAALIEAFGEQYRSYIRRTKRLIPFVY